MRHREAQCLAMTKGMLQILHQIEGLTSAKKVGPLAENLLGAIEANNKEVQDFVKELRRLTREEKKDRAMKKRKKMLKKMGFKNYSKVSSAGIKIYTHTYTHINAHTRTHTGKEREREIHTH